ncbi:MAG: hypothetical protein RLZZ556_764 [Actinomycetota bacterium]|jgi:DNA-binding XRE family transcriptional regulator
MSPGTGKLSLRNTSSASDQKWLLKLERRLHMALVRQEIGDVLRDLRQQKGFTLRQVASRAKVALGYLSEIERGQKEASSEILSSVAAALDVPISQIMHLVAERFEAVETVVIPDTVPAELVTNYDSKSMANTR